jgi:hypothetical protein
LWSRITTPSSRPAFLLKFASDGFQLLLEVRSQFVQELLGGEVVRSLDAVGITLDANGKILGHEASFDGLNADVFQSLREVSQLSVVVQLGAVSKTSGPGKDGGNRVGAGFLSLLVHSVVASDGTVGSLSFDGLAVRANQNGGHHTQRAETLSNGVRLNVTVVVLAGPDEATVGFHGVSDHIVDQTVLVDDTSGFELSLVFSFVDDLEDVLEATVVSLQDGVLGAQVQRPLLLQSIDEAGTSEGLDGLVSVVHAHKDTTVLEVEDFNVLGLRSVGGSEGNFEFSGAVNNQVGGFVLISEGVSADDNRASPARNQSGDVLADNGFSEDSTTQNITDSTVRAQPHLLQAEFLNTSLIRGDGGALNTNVVLLDGLGSINGNLIIRLVTVFHAKIEVLNVNIQVREDELLKKNKR